MKKTLRMMGLCALAVLALAACKKNEQTDSKTTVKAAITQPTGNAKTGINSNHMLVWHSGDQISVFSADRTVGSWFITEDDNTTLATFTIDSDTELEVTDGCYAFSPATAITISDDVFVLNFINPQTGVANNFGPADYPMCATFSGGKFQFHSPCGLLAIPLKGTGTVGSIVLSGSPEDKLYGDFHYNPADMSAPTDFVADNTPVTLNFGASGLPLQTDVADTVYFVVPAGVFANGFTAVIKDLGGSEIATLATTKDNTILAEHIMLMPLVTIQDIAVTTDPIANVGSTDATINGSYVAPTGMAVTEVGFYWGPGADMTNKQVATTDNPFSLHLTGLSGSTTYSYQAYAQNGNIEKLGAVETFTTEAIVAPTMTTGTVMVADSGTSTNTATGHVTLTDAGNLGDVTELGLCWGTSSNPTIADSHATAAGTTVNTEYAVTTPQLNSGTTYYFRSYVKVGDVYYYAGNEVSVKSYYLIYTLEDWNNLAAAVNNGTDATAEVVQMANISGVTTMVGNSESHPFRGKYNGQGYTISNVAISGGSEVGLFGTVDDNSSVIENVVVTSGSVSATGQNVGSIVGKLKKGNMHHCANYASVSSSYNGNTRIGGIVGWMASTNYGGSNNQQVYDCINYGNVHAKNYVGGVVGSLGGGFLTRCQNYGTVTADGWTPAGIAGWRTSSDNSCLTYSHNGGNIVATQSSSGSNAKSKFLISNFSISSYSNGTTNTYLSSITVTDGGVVQTSTNYATYAYGAVAVTSNPAGITIGGTTYSWDTPAPVAP